MAEKNITSRENTTHTYSDDLIVFDYQFCPSRGCSSIQTFPPDIRSRASKLYRPEKRKSFFIFPACYVIHRTLYMSCNLTRSVADTPLVCMYNRLVVYDEGSCNVVSIRITFDVFVQYTRISRRPNTWSPTADENGARPTLVRTCSIAYNACAITSIV